MKSQGFTVYELLVTMMIMATVFGVAIPNLSHYVKSIESKVFKATVLRHLKLARNYSINYGKDFTICGVNEQLMCIEQNFNKLAVFADDNDNRQMDESELVVRISELDYHGNVNLRAAFGRSYLELLAKDMQRSLGVLSIVCRNFLSFRRE